MSVILSIDFGTSATKIAGLSPDGSILFTLRTAIPAQSPNLREELNACLTAYSLSLHDMQNIVLTGTGAAYVDSDTMGTSICKVDEFSASCAGALALSGQEQAVIATLGTGTAFLWADNKGTIRHLCGTGIDGATLCGLSEHLFGISDVCQIDALASQGNLSNVDLTIADITRNPPPTLDLSLTAANFGKLTKSLSPADLAAGTANLVLQSIGTMTVLACQCCDCRTVVLTGSLTAMTQAKTNFETFERLYGIHYIIPENAAFATAIGAGLCSLRQKSAD